MQSRLCVCGNEIPWNRSLCPECLARYGGNRAKWPEWLHWLVRDMQREIDANRYHDELVLADGDNVQLPDGKYPSDMDNAAIETSWRWVHAHAGTDDVPTKPNGRPLVSADLMRYAPYADEAANREYRRANWIKERKG